MAIDKLRTLLDGLGGNAPAGGHLNSGPGSLHELLKPAAPSSARLAVVQAQPKSQTQQPSPNSGSTGMTGGDSGFLHQLQSLAAEKQAAAPPPKVRGASSRQASPGGSSGMGTFDQIASTGLSFLPFIGGLLHLFGVGQPKAKTLPPLRTFQLPPQIRTEAGLSSNGETFMVDRGADGQIRRAPAVAGGGPAGSGDTVAPAGNSTAAPAAITVQVNAMDSQSFLDRRDDIARAVREAMLHSSSLNDVVSEV